jgi:prolyl 4-hydroxylase
LKPHFDFFPSNIEDKGQPARFATLLLYLNNPEKGGETSFPRWVNAKTKDILEVTPSVGKAVLFYNQLPDGNYDDRSQHSAKPLIKGEKVRT